LRIKIGSNARTRELLTEQGPLGTSIIANLRGSDRGFGVFLSEVPTSQVAAARDHRGSAFIRA
jgi:hypothetical protein